MRCFGSIDQVSHRVAQRGMAIASVRLAAAADVDKDLVGWLRAAYDKA